MLELFLIVFSLFVALLLLIYPDVTIFILKKIIITSFDLSRSLFASINKEINKASLHSHIQSFPPDSNRRFESIVNSFRNFWIALVLIFTACLFLLKINSILLSSSIIPPELFKSPNISESKFNALNALFTEDLCNKLLLPDELDPSWILTKCNSVTKETWVERNGYAPTFHSSYRGGYIHHYSTIMFPYFQSRSGDYSALITAQYGVVSVLPLYLIKAVFETIPFYYYNISGYCLALLIIFILSLYFCLNGKTKTPVLFLGSFLLLIWVLSLNAGALAMAPGFSFFRILPTCLLLVLMFKRGPMLVMVLLSIFLAVINSIAFNILLVIPMIGFILLQNIKFFNHSFGRISSPLNFAVTGGIIFALLFQTIITYLSGGDNILSISGSFFETESRTILGILRSIILTNCVVGLLFVLAVKFGNSEQRLLSFYGLVMHTVLSIYVLRFFGSPQHFSSFLLMTSPMVLLLANRLSDLLIVKWFVLPLVAVLLLYQNSLYNYTSTSGMKPPKIVANFEPSPIGVPLEFPITDNIKGALAEISHLLSDFDASLEKNSAQIFYASREKSFLELLISKPLSPQVYDFYTTINTIDKKVLREKIRNYDVLVLPSVEEIQEQKFFLTTLYRNVAVDEFKKHIAILDGMLWLYDNTDFGKKVCGNYYCVIGVWN